MFPLVREAVESVITVSGLGFIALSHFEADECCSLNEWLAIAPLAVPLCSEVAAMVSVNDFAARPAYAMADGAEITLGKHSVKWLDAPHLPHGWETGFLTDTRTKTMFCGDFFAQGGIGAAALTESDILENSEAFRKTVDYSSHSTNTRQLIEKLASELPDTLACMHGSAWKGDGANLLRALGERLVSNQSQPL